MNQDAHVETELAAYVDGRLDDAARTRVAAHMDSCAACAHVADGMRAVARVLDDDETAMPLAPMWPAIARRRDPVQRRVADLGFALATAASLAAGFTLGVLAIRDGTAPGVPAATATTADADLLVASETTLSDVYFSGGTNGAEQTQ